MNCRYIKVKLNDRICFVPADGLSMVANSSGLIYAISVAGYGCTCVITPSGEIPVKDLDASSPEEFYLQLAVHGAFFESDTEPANVESTRTEKIVELERRLEAAKTELNEIRHERDTLRNRLSEMRNRMLDLFEDQPNRD